MAASCSPRTIAKPKISKNKKKCTKKQNQKERTESGLGLREQRQNLVRTPRVRHLNNFWKIWSFERILEKSSTKFKMYWKTFCKPHSNDPQTAWWCNRPYSQFFTTFQILKNCWSKIKYSKLTKLDEKNTECHPRNSWKLTKLRCPEPNFHVGHSQSLQKFYAILPMNLDFGTCGSRRKPKTHKKFVIIRIVLTKFEKNWNFAKLTNLQNLKSLTLGRHKIWNR